MRRKQQDSADAKYAARPGAGGNRRRKTEKRQKQYSCRTPRNKRIDPSIDRLPHLAEKPADADELHVDVVLRVGGPRVSGGVPEGDLLVVFRLAVAVARRLGLAGRTRNALRSLRGRARLRILVRTCAS